MVDFFFLGQHFGIWMLNIAKYHDFFALPKIEKNIHISYIFES